jgi:hypothetical protein
VTIATLPADGSRAAFADILPPIPDNGTPVARLHFDSLGDLAALIPDSPRKGRPGSAWRDNDDKDFYGVTMTEARTLARDGWQEGAERVQPLLDRVKTARPTRKALTRWDVAGAVPSIPRYLAGNPLHMRTRQISATSQQPIITLISSTSAPWWTATATFERLACAAAAIVDRLEDAGFRVEIIAGRRESSNGTGAGTATGDNNALGHRSEMFFRVKAAQDSLDLARVAFGIGHPSVHRRLLFAAGNSHPAFDESLGDNQGFAVGLPPLERPLGAYILPALAHLEKQVKHDPVAVFDHVIETLKAQGCPGLE